MYINIFKIIWAKKNIYQQPDRKNKFSGTFSLFYFWSILVKKNNKKYQLTKYGYICLLLNLIYMYIFENM